MESLETRISKAKELWARGEIAERNGEFKQAYKLFTEAHDNVVDCTEYHRYAHAQLMRINRKGKNNYEYVTDIIALYILGPLGLFHGISYFSNKSAYFSELCRRHA